MNIRTLRQQNKAYMGTAGISDINRSAGFIPAFRDDATGRVEIAKFRYGEPAPMHLLVGLPKEWATAYDANNDIVGVKNTIVAGFVRRGKFYTREEARLASS